MANHFVQTPEELFEALQEFNKAPNYHRKMIGSNPRYFVHSISNGRHLFGLSKFCAFKGITAEDYLMGKRGDTDGGITQKHIERITEQEWKPYNSIGKSIQMAFDQWLSQAFPTFKSYDKLGFITIAAIAKTKRRQHADAVSQDDLDKILAQKKLIGNVGELIALRYEARRLKALGAEEPELYITHTAKLNVGAGFDIYSDYDKKPRYIEVKASIDGKGLIYITSNELTAFRLNDKESYLYIVNITDIDKEEGTVREVKTIDELGTLEPVLYKLVK